MTAAVRKTPTNSNGGSDVGVNYTDAVDTEIEALWKCVATYLTSVAGTNSITAASDTALVAVIAAYSRPMTFWLVPANTNTGGVQINIDSVGLVNITDKDGNALPSGALAAGREHLITFDGTQFRLLSTSSADLPQTAPDMIVREEQATNTQGGAFTSGSFVTRVLNTVVRNVLTGASLASNQFTLQAGTYLIQWSSPGYAVNAHQTRLFNVTDSSVVETGTSAFTTAASDVMTESRGWAVVTLTSTKAFRIEHKCQTTAATNGLGIATNLGAKEVYSWVNVWKSGSLAALSTGIPGGAITFSQVIDTSSTADADPGNALLRFNNATQNAATTLYLDLLDYALTDMTAVIDTVDKSTDLLRASLRLTKYDDPTKWLIYSVTARTTASGYRKITVANVASSTATPFANGDRVIVTFSRTGSAGLDGATAIRYTFSTTTTDSDPGNGTLRLDNATQSSAVTIRTDLLDNLGTDWTSALDHLDASSSTVKGQVRLYKANDPTQYLLFDLASRAVPSGYRNLTVTNIGGSSASPFANGDAIVFSFTRSGDKGSTGATGSLTSFGAANAGFTLINGQIVTSVSGSALTIAIKGNNGSDPAVGNEVYCVVRDATAPGGSYSLVTLTAAISLVISSGSTMGAANATPFRLWIVGFLDSGTFRIGAINCLSGTSIYPLSAWQIASSTAEGGAGAADNAQTFYTGTAVTGKPYTILGYLSYETGLTTAGTWAATPTRTDQNHHGMPMPGQVVQSSYTQNGANTSTANTYAISNTAPAIGGGGVAVAAPAMSASSAANLIEVEGRALIGNSSGINPTTFIYNGTANLATSGSCTTSGTQLANVPVFWSGQAGVVSAVTYTLYYTGSAGTTAINGENGTPLLGGTGNTHIRVRELMA